MGFKEIESCNIDSILTALASSPVYAIFCVWDSYMNLEWGWEDYVYCNMGNEILSVHAVVIVGYNDNDEYWICKDSYGNRGMGGPDGYFNIGFGVAGIDTWLCYTAEVNEESFAKITPIFMPINNTVSYDFNDDQNYPEAIYIAKSCSLYNNVEVTKDLVYDYDYLEDYIDITLNGYYFKYDNYKTVWCFSSVIPEDFYWEEFETDMVGYFPNFVSAINNSSDDDEIWVYSNASVPSGQTATTGENLEIYFDSSIKLEIFGTLTVNNGVVFTGSNWNGIDLKQGAVWPGTLDVDGDITIEYAACGIDLYDGGRIINGENTITIQDCSSAGLWVGSTQTVQNIYCDDTGSYYGGIFVSGSSSNPVVNHVEVHSSGHGIYVAVNGNATVDYCDFCNDNTNDSVCLTSGGMIDLDGNNNICPKEDKKAINNYPTGDIDAEHNWWGTDNPTDALFAFPDPVEYYDTHLDSYVESAGPYKIAYPVESDPIEVAQQYEFSGDFDTSLDLYKNLLNTETDQLKKKFIITSILRVNDKYNKDYSYLKNIVPEELETATSYYKPSLDFILCDILLREGKYEEAIAAFTEKAEKYKGTSIEVEMLSKIAMIYGNNLNDKTKAKEFADKAASLNPGQHILRLAYEVADVEYDPLQFVDKFEGKFEQFDNLNDPEKPAFKEIPDFATVNPNPLNPRTTITYSVKNPSHVKLVIYSITGQKAATLVDQHMSAGSHSVRFDGSDLGSGVYLYKLESKGFNKTGKMLLMK